MRWVATWLTACLATATFGQVHIINRHDVTEPPAVSVIPIHPTLQINGSNLGHIPVTNDNSLLNEVNNDTGSEDGPSSSEDSKSSSEDSNNKSSRSEESGEPVSGEKPSNEIPSNEIPELSIEIPSHEIASSSNESPALSNEIPSPSNEILSSSNESPEASNEMASSSKEIPEVPGSSSDESSANNSEGETDPGVDVDLPEIETTFGTVKGVKWHDDTNIIAYIDIPYGKIETPFEAPRTADAWETIHEVEEHTKRCPQFIENRYQGDLDCLTLSVFAPAGAEAASVLFHIHNSDFYSGDPMIYGPEHLVSKGLILVLPNYRVGALGFLCLQNETAPGNAGLKDLSKALDWVAHNIERFGGNPSNIVVSGDGEAGALAGYLALSSHSNKNIKKVITESGSMLSHGALDRHPEITAWTLGENIRNEDTNALLNNPFAEATAEVIVRAATGMQFNPCIELNEEPFFSLSPWVSLQNREINITFMIGSASHAGAHQAMATSDTFIENLNEDYGLILPKDLSFHSTAERDTKALEVKSQYFGNATISRDNIQELSLWFTDASYLGPVMRWARCLVDAGASVYLFEFDYVGELNRELIALKSPVEGAARSDIIGYLFTQDGYIPDEKSNDKAMIDLMVGLWVSFINTGTPTASGIEWSELQAGAASEEEFLHIASETTSEQGMHVGRLQLWTNLYNDFFIERNFAISITPGNYLFITLIFWVTRTKLDYQ